MKKFLVIMAFCFVCVSCLFGCALFPSDCEIAVVNLNVEGGTATNSETYKEGEEITLVAKPKEGYYFEGWKDEDGHVISYKETYTFEVEESMDLTVSFKKGTALLIEDSKLVGAVNAVFDVDYAKREFTLKHPDDKSHIGYWYEGEDNGYKNEGSFKHISFDDVKDGAYYQFHEGTAFFYGAAVDDDAYTAFLNCKTKAEIDYLVSNEKIILSNLVTAATEGSEINTTLDLSSGNLAIEAYMYVDAEGVERVITSMGFLYTGINFTTTYNFVLGGRTFTITVTTA